MEIVEELKKSIGRICIVGVPHSYYTNRLFFYKGNLKAVDNNLAQLECKNGPVFISIDRIKEFREERHTQQRSGDF